MKKTFVIITAVIIIMPFTSNGQQKKYPETKVTFRTTDTELQKVYDRAEELALGNITDYSGKKVLVEGAQYKNVWLETQPMGGYMYAKRNIEIAKNNVEIFMDHQRQDGRLPGVIYNRNGLIQPDYCQFQGLYFCRPAYELYFLLNRDTEFLKKIYTSLEKFDAYFWKTRDYDNNGCLEAWCVYDLGEDNGERFAGSPRGWSLDTPPDEETIRKFSKQDLKTYTKENSWDSTRKLTVPIESMDVMSFSYSCRDILALISKELKNGKEKYWRGNADEVRNKIKSYLWDPQKNACYDKDKTNKTMPILLHNNLRCMYLGSFDQEMADKFVKYHLLNPDEFWTPMPLPSIAANDPAFRNIKGNNWSGQPQGLTFQRSIQALENYGHYAELTMIGAKFLDVIADSLKFTQQFDPFTTQINYIRDGYGPTILAALEFISRLYGIHITQDKVYWSCLDNNHDYKYVQNWNNTEFSLQTTGKNVQCSINGKPVLTFTKGARIVTDLKGKLIEIVGIETVTKKIQLKSDREYRIDIEPNSVYSPDSKGNIEKKLMVEFAYR